MGTDDLLKEAVGMCCASCGTAEIDDTKLKDCNKCDLARYCSDKCQEDHRQTHEAICKERAAELREEVLFRHPESTHLGDCPICFLPVPQHVEYSIQTCCGKIICQGCLHANKMREMTGRLKRRCLFCRKIVPETEHEANINYENRIAANDPVALREMGGTKRKEGDYDSAFQYYTRAAAFGDAESHFYLSCFYREGSGVERDKKMEVYHLEEAAIAGDPDSRYNLGLHEFQQGRFGRAVKHWIIAANLGDNESIQKLKASYKYGMVNKEDFAKALRAHQATVDATKSPQREEAAAQSL